MVESNEREEDAEPQRAGASKVIGAITKNGCCIVFFFTFFLVAVSGGHAFPI